jgi:hypothetical protein
MNGYRRIDRSSQTPEQKQEQELNELLQLYSPERREAMRKKILQRNKKKK